MHIEKIQVDGRMWVERETLLGDRALKRGPGIWHLKRYLTSLIGKSKLENNKVLFFTSLVNINKLILFSTGDWIANR